MSARGLVFLALIAVDLTMGCSSGRPGSYSGFVDSPVAAVASQVSGQVTQVLVHEGDRVTRGQIVARLDARERAALEQEAEANVQHEREALREAERNADAIAPTVRAAEADIARQQAELDDATIERERARRLVASGAGTLSDLDTAQARWQQARAAVESLGASRQATRGRVTASLAGVRTALAGLQSSEAAVELARVQLAEAEITSPFDGVVADVNLVEGEWAAPGTPVLTVEDQRRQWVRIDVEETELGALRIGQPWLRAFSAVDPETHAVAALKAILFRNGDLAAAAQHVLFLGAFAAVMTLVAMTTMKRQL